MAYLKHAAPLGLVSLLVASPFVCVEPKSGGLIAGDEGGNSPGGSTGRPEKERPKQGQKDGHTSGGSNHCRTTPTTLVQGQSPLSGSVGANHA